MENRYKDATLTLKLNADSGYESKQSFRIDLKDYEQVVKLLNAMQLSGVATQTTDINGRRIYLGDKVVYKFKSENNKRFTVVFEDNAFRKKYNEWDESLPKPILENDTEAKEMMLMVVSSNII